MLPPHYQRFFKGRRTQRSPNPNASRLGAGVDPCTSGLLARMHVVMIHGVPLSQMVAHAGLSVPLSLCRHLQPHKCATNGQHGGICTVIVAHLRKGPDTLCCCHIPVGRKGIRSGPQAVHAQLAESHQTAFGCFRHIALYTTGTTLLPCC